MRESIHRLTTFQFGQQTDALAGYVPSRVLFPFCFVLFYFIDMLHHQIIMVMFSKV